MDKESSASEATCVRVIISSTIFGCSPTPTGFSMCKRIFVIALSRSAV